MDKKETNNQSIEEEAKKKSGDNLAESMLFQDLIEPEIFNEKVDELQQEEYSDRTLRVVDELQYMGEYETNNESSEKSSKSQIILPMPIKDSKLFQCKFCPKEYLTKSTLNRHQRTHSANKFACHICNNIFPIIEDLKQHTAIFHKNDWITYSCQYCNRKFANNKCLRNHKAVHEGVKEGHLPCDICGRKYFKLYDLNKHIRIHAYKGEICCKICKQRFISIESLDQHMKTHEEDKPENEEIFFCNVCSTSFSNSSMFVSHLKRHEDQKQSCEICSAIFLDSDTLEEHYKGHTEILPYKCTFCDKKFAKLEGQKAHEDVHQKPRSFECKFCSERFDFLKSLKIHEAGHINSLKEEIVQALENDEYE